MIDFATLAAEYRQVRARTEKLCAPLEAEDYSLQVAPFVSPPKWHLAHVTWFFERFLLQPFLPDYQVFDSAFDHLFNSYYLQIGKPFPRAHRGWLSRPAVARIQDYRAAVDAAMTRLLNNPPRDAGPTIGFRVELGLHHEQQHQELLLMDLKYSFAQNPIDPIYQPIATTPTGTAKAMQLVSFEGGLCEVGHPGTAFCFDNETPRHRVFLKPYRLADRLVNHGDFQNFIDDGGYHNSAFWLSDGWSWLQATQRRRPEYYRDEGEFTLHGLLRRDPAAPIAHLTYYEADAYARWAEKRLPTEFEWEHAAAQQADQAQDGPFQLHPGPPAPHTAPLAQMHGVLWQWTASPYLAYPGYTPFAGAVGEYNGKFMCNQMVLRGGCCITPPGHLRHTYRNFFYPDQSWAFCGLRLAEDG